MCVCVCGNSIGKNKIRRRGGGSRLKEIGGRYCWIDGKIIYLFKCEVERYVKWGKNRERERENKGSKTIMRVLKYGFFLISLLKLLT